VTRALVLLSLVGCLVDIPQPNYDSNSDDQIPGANTPWDQKSDEEKYAWMVYEVTPAMQEYFAEFDPRYERGFDCSSCHGDAADREVYTHIPSTSGLGILYLDDWPSNSDDPDVRAVAAFMEETVVPQMAVRLSRQEGMAEGEVNCGTCHVVQ